MKETPKNTNLHKLRAMDKKGADKNFESKKSKTAPKETKKK